MLNPPPNPHLIGWFSQSLSIFKSSNQMDIQIIHSNDRKFHLLPWSHISSSRWHLSEEATLEFRTLIISFLFSFPLSCTYTHIPPILSYSCHIYTILLWAILLGLFKNVGWVRVESFKNCGFGGYSTDATTFLMSSSNISYEHLRILAWWLISKLKIMNAQV